MSVAGSRSKAQQVRDLQAYCIDRFDALVGTAVIGTKQGSNRVRTQPDVRSGITRQGSTGARPSSGGGEHVGESNHVHVGPRLVGMASQVQW